MSDRRASGPPPPHLVLRTATAPCHECVDAAFGHFLLDRPASYGRFLLAHARALPALEAVSARLGLDNVRARLPLLLADLDDLGIASPVALEPALDGSIAARWGVAYVLEGSRLGGAMLARQVANGLPHRFLSAGHGPGEWRSFRAALDAALTPDMLPDAVAAAEAAFALYQRAAEDDDQAIDDRRIDD